MVGLDTNGKRPIIIISLHEARSAVWLGYFDQSTLPIWPGHSTLVSCRGLWMRFGLEEATAGLVRPLLLTDNDAPSAEGPAGFKHEWDDEGAGTKRPGGCVAGLFDGNDRVSVVCTSVAKTASVIMPIFSGRPGYK